MGISFKTSLRENQLASSVQSAEEKYHRETLKAAVDAETSARESVDAEIKADIAQLYQNLSDEIVLRAQDDLNVKNELQAAIDSETAIRSSQISTVQRTLEDESAARIAADNAIRADYISADSALLDSINDNYTPKINSLTDALHNEETLSAQRDATLASDLTASINAEKSARTSADTSLKSAIDAEISTRTSQTDSLGAAVTKEISDRTNAVNNLQTNLSTAIGNEATARAAAVTALQNSITSAVSNVQASLKEYTPSTTAKDGTSGIMPAPPKLKTDDEILVATHKGWQTLAEANIFIGAIPSQNGEPQYTGNAISPSWLNFEDQKMAIGGTTSATNAGTYTATFTPTGLYCWNDGTRTAKSVQWRIAPKIVTIPTAAVTEFEYTGNNITLSVTNPNSDCINASGATWAVNAGSYTATYKLKSTTNYVFSDGTTTDKTINWKINAKRLAKPTASVTSFTYNKSVQGLTVSNYDATYMTKTGSDTATAAASYSVTYSLKSTTNTLWSDGTSANVVINWSIAVLKLTKPSASTTSFTYDGTSKNLSVSNFNSNYESVSGSTSEINAGAYSATYSLNDTTNTKWADNSTANVVISWSIARQKLTAAQSTFSQSGTLTYTGNSQSPTISGYNASYHDLGSTTSATNAGSYTLTVTPKSNFAFSDGSTAAKSVSWSIGVLKLTKPTASTTEFIYSGSTFTLDVANYNSTYMTRTGTVSASAEGNYSVTYTLKDTNNYKWQDNSSTAVTINWKIKVNKFEKPTISAGASLEYTGGTLKPTIANYDSDKMTQSGSASAVNVGTYTITYALKDKVNTTWSDGSTSDISLEWVITRKKLTAAQSTFSQSGTLTYTGSAQTVSISGYNASYHELSSTTSATNAGTYTAQVTPKSNYAFSDGSTAAKNVSWSIGAKALTKPTAAKTTFEYDGAEKTLSISNYNSSYMTKSGVDSASIKGSYTVTFTLNSTSNFKWADNSTAAHSIVWSIGAKSITKPTISGDTTFTYDGNAKTITVNGYDSTTMTVSGTLSATNAGNYTATYTLRDKSNTCWASGDTNDVQFSWTINRAKLSAELSDPSRFSLSQTSYTFNFVSKGGGGWKDGGANNEVRWSANGKTFEPAINGLDANAHKVEGTYKQSNVGTYTLYIYPNDNYCWSDGTKSFITSFKWTILPMRVTKPTLDTTSFEYTGQTITPPITDFSPPNPGTSEIYRHTNVIGTKSAVNVGSYSVVYSQELQSYIQKWEDETTSAVTINWEITAKKLAKPTMPTTSFEWTGSNISPTVNNYDSTWIEKSGTDTASAIGTYTITYALKDKSNTTWADGSTDDISLEWQISRIRLNIISYAFIERCPICGVYNGSEIDVRSLDFLFNKSGIEVSGDVIKTEAGDYIVTVQPDSYHAWSNGSVDSRDVPWSINKRTITKPTLTAENVYDGTIGIYTYNGNVQSPTFIGYDSNYMTMTGADPTATIDMGTYTVTFVLKNKTSTVWEEDGSTSDIKFQWIIYRKSITKPTLTNTTFTYDGTAHSPTINNYDSTYVTQTGTASSTNAGNFTLTYALKNKTSTQWEGGGTDDISLSWVINKKRPTLTISASGSPAATLTNASPNFELEASCDCPVTPTFSWRTNDSSVITLPLESLPTWTINNEDFGPRGTKVTFTANGAGDIIIDCKTPQTTNYSSVTQSFSLACRFLKKLGDCNLNEICLAVKYLLLGNSTLNSTQEWVVGNLCRVPYNWSFANEGIQISNGFSAWRLINMYCVGKYNSIDFIENYPIAGNYCLGEIPSGANASNYFTYTGQSTNVHNSFANALKNTSKFNGISASFLGATPGNNCILIGHNYEYFANGNSIAAPNDWIATYTNTQFAVVLTHSTSYYYVDNDSRVSYAYRPVIKIVYDGR